MSDLVLFVDLDGVLVDFRKGACRVHDRLDLHSGNHESFSEYGFHRTMGISKAQFWEPINALGANFWAFLEPYPWNAELLSYLAGWESRLCSDATASRHCPAGKMLWIERHLPARFLRDYVFTNEKHILARHPGAILLDDKEENVDRFTLSGGRAVLFPQPWNRNRGLLENLIQNVIQQLEDLR